MWFSSFKEYRILAVTETRFRPHSTAACIADIYPSCYSFYHRPCLLGWGGGVVFLISEHFKVKHSNHNYSSFEYMWADTDSSFSACFVCIYRHPRHPANFYEHFQDLFENLATSHSELYILSDCNFHLDMHSSITTMFDDILT